MREPFLLDGEQRRALKEAEGDFDAAGQDGFEEVFRKPRNEEKMGVGWGFLKSLQKCICGLFHEAVGLEEDSHLGSTGKRAQMEFRFQIPHHIDANPAAFAFRFNAVAIRMRQRRGRTLQNQSGKTGGEFAGSASFGARHQIRVGKAVLGLAVSEERVGFS